MDWRKRVFNILIFVGLGGFDLYNFATTNYALASFGDIAFTIANLTIKVSIGLAIALCLIDFAGVSSVFTEESWPNEPLHIWLLTAGWLIAAVANAFLTWWANVLVIQNSTSMMNALFTPEQIAKVVPALVAGLVFMIRILLIGSIVAASNGPQKRAQARPNFSPASAVRNLANSMARPMAPKPEPKHEPAFRSLGSPNSIATPGNGKVRVNEINLDDLLK